MGAEQSLLTELQQSVHGLPFWSLSCSPSRDLLSAIDRRWVGSMFVRPEMHLASMGRANKHWLDMTGVAMEWCRRYPTQRGRHHRLSAPVVTPALNRVESYVAIEQALWRTTNYGYGFQREGSEVWITPPDDCSVELLDSLIVQHAWSIESPPSSAAVVGLDDCWDALADVRGQRNQVARKQLIYRQLRPAIARELLQDNPIQLRILDVTDKILGCEVRHLVNVWSYMHATLSAELWLAHALAFVRQQVLSTTPEKLADSVTSQYPETSRTSALQAIELLTFSPSHPSGVERNDHALLPMYQDHQQLLSPIATVLANRPERLLLRLAGQDHAQFGRIADRVDSSHELAQAIATAVTDEPILIATEVPFTTPTSSGDLDVVVLAPQSQTGFIVEVGSSIPLAAGREFMRAADKLHMKMQSQIPKNRTALTDPEAIVRWPSDWHCDAVTWHWGISGGEYIGLTAHRRTHQLFTESRLVEVAINELACLPSRPTLNDLIEQLQHPPVPPHTIHTKSIRFGDLTVHLDMPMADPAAPPDQPLRR